MAESTQSGVGLYLSASEIKHLIAAARSDRDRLLLRILWATGGRINEVVRIRATDIQEEDAAIQMPNLKRKKGQVATKRVAIDEDLIAECLDWCQLNGIDGVGYLFAGRASGTHLSARQARNIFYRAAAAAGVERPQFVSGQMGPAWPHLMRHSMATHMVKTGTDVTIIAKQLGHTQIRNTMVYLTVDLTDQAAAVKRLPRVS